MDSGLGELLYGCNGAADEWGRHMPDWNGDGKNDWHDDYVFNEIINKPAKKPENKTKSSDSGVGCSIAAAIAVIWELFNLVASMMYR